MLIKLYSFCLSFTHSPTFLLLFTFSSPQTFYFDIVEDKFFTPHDFISLATRTTSILSWILGKSLLKPKKSPYLHKNASKSMVQNSWRYYLIKAHDSSSWHNISFSAHEPHQGNFGSRGLDGQEVCSIKLLWFKVYKGKHVAWHVFPNSLNFDGSVCNR